MLAWGAEQEILVWQQSLMSCNIVHRQDLGTSTLRGLGFRAIVLHDIRNCTWTVLVTSGSPTLGNKDFESFSRVVSARLRLFFDSP